MARQIVNGGGRVPYGDIFAVNTPYLDQLSAQLYADQKQRQAQRQSESERLDQEFSRSAAKIRDADVNEYADKYNQWKQAKMGLMKMNPTSNSKEYIAAQLDANKKLADMSRFGNESISTKAALMDNGKQLMADKNGKYIDAAHDILIKANQTPTSQLGNFALPDDKGNLVPFDPLNIDNYNRHIDTKGVMDAIKNAQGKPQKYTGDKYKDNPTDLQYQQPEVSTLNKPIDFYSNMMLAATKNPKDFANTLPHPDDLTYMQTEEKYNQLMQDGKLKGNWRIGDGEDLPDDKDIHSDLEKAIKYQAMTYALNPNNQPQVKIKPVTDLTAKTDRAEQFATNKMYAQHKLTQDNIRLSAGLKNDKESNDAITSADAVLHNLHDIISTGKPTENAFFGKSKDSDNVVEISDPNLLKTFSTIVKDGTTPVPADHIYFNKQTNQGVLIYNMSDGSEKKIPISGADMAKAKAKETYTGANAGKVIDVIDKVVTKNGGLTNTLKMYEPNQSDKSKESGNVKVNINGKVYQVPKSNLSKMDKDGVPYKVIQ